MRKRKWFIMIVILLFCSILCSCSDPNYVYSEDWYETEATLLEKYQEVNKNGHIVNIFKIEIEEEELKFEVSTAMYVSYHKKDKLNITIHKEFNSQGTLIGIYYYLD
ncbi:MAG: hypothetical protein IJK18_03950 [Clostridia bacterium]|nr:hypothetical protein [Clostridia bacterium]